jgi:RNA polymerase sigma-32 factor
MANYNLPVLQESGLTAYIDAVNKFPMLDEQEEYMLAVRYKETQDLQAAHKLVTSHLRLVVKIAMSFRGYGLPMSDVISEGNLGLMQAVKKFEPEKGFRLSTYAMWWIKASINEFILKSWSVVKVGTSAAQKKLFFNLKRLKNKIMGVESSSAISDEAATSIAKSLEVSKEEVIEMDGLLMGGAGHSLNQFAYEEDGEDQINFLEDVRANQEVELGNQEEQNYNSKILVQAMKKLNQREKDILIKRRLVEKPFTLEDLSSIYKISRERVRQIESKAMEKLQKAITSKVPNFAFQ